MTNGGKQQQAGGSQLEVLTVLAISGMLFALGIAAARALAAGDEAARTAGRIEALLRGAVQTAAARGRPEVFAVLSDRIVRIADGRIELLLPPKVEVLSAVFGRLAGERNTFAAHPGGTVSAGRITLRLQSGKSCAVVIGIRGAVRHEC